jgi:hypothetical protein
LEPPPEKGRKAVARSLSFTHLSDVEFEGFCFELLEELSFVNVDWRKGTGKKSRPSDRGRDIVCQEQRRDVDGSLHLDTWFVDCKHFTKGVPPRELQNLLAWSEAKRPATALFIASGFLSNAAKDYLDDYRRTRRPPFKIKVWENPQLRRMTARKVAFLRRHDLLEEPIRSVWTILRAEHEVFDKVWYNRHLVMLEKLEAGEETIHPDVLKLALAAGERKRREYGEENFGPWDDFEWGMLNGKLSALRWVLGDEWGFLDT